MNSGNDIPLFPGTFLLLSVLELWANLTSAGGAFTWHGGVIFLLWEITSYASVVVLG